MVSSPRTIFGGSPPPLLPGPSGPRSCSLQGLTDVNYLVEGRRLAKTGVSWTDGRMPFDDRHLSQLLDQVASYSCACTLLPGPPPTLVNGVLLLGTPLQGHQQEMFMAI